MPKRWYIAGSLVFVILAAGIWCLASHVPARPKAVELAGTILTLLPVLLDTARKFYIRRVTARLSPDEFAEKVTNHVRAALLEYDWLYGIAILLGVSLVALGFAMDLVRPEIAPLAGHAEG